MLTLTRPVSGRHRAAWALGVYVLATLVYFAAAAPAILREHTPYNHYAQLAAAWLGGHLHLPGPPPAYSGNNDFAYFSGHWHVAFPPFPALLLTPLVYLGGSAENVQDGQFFLWLAGLAPAFLLLSLEKCVRLGLSRRSFGENLTLCGLFAFGTVYFFSVEQGTVWYAAHVVAAVLCAAFLWLALGAEQPLLAGSVLACAFLTRPPLLLASLFFASEAWRVSAMATTRAEVAARFGWRERLRVFASRRCVARLVPFVLPLLVAGVFSLVYNWLRFGDPFESGYRYLRIAWRARIEKWGLFDYHYLAKNLGVVLASLPWYEPSQRPPFRVNAHGLALWVTTPAYLWLLWPRRVRPSARFVRRSLYVVAALVAIPTLFYQNTGWVQFGYRFSNDYAPLLIVLLALGARRFATGFYIALGAAIVINTFGALTFGRDGFSAYYYEEPSQRILFQPD